MDAGRTHILIVEDSEDDCDMFAFYLSRKGYQVSVAGDGKAALEKAVELHPNLIVMDLWLPVMSGWDVMRRLKEDARTQHIPVVVVTGHSFIRPPGCDGWHTKPCPPERIEPEITKILASRAENGRTELRET